MPSTTESHSHKPMISLSINLPKDDVFLTKILENLKEQFKEAKFSKTKTIYHTYEFVISVSSDQEGKLCSLLNDMENSRGEKVDVCKYSVTGDDDRSMISDTPTMFTKVKPSDHSLERNYLRELDEQTIKKIKKYGVSSPGNVQGRTKYSYAGYVIVLGSNDYLITGYRKLYMLRNAFAEGIIEVVRDHLNYSLIHEYERYSLKTIMELTGIQRKYIFMIFIYLKEHLDNFSFKELQLIYNCLECVAMCRRKKLFETLARSNFKFTLDSIFTVNETDLSLVLLNLDDFKSIIGRNGNTYVFRNIKKYYRDYYLSACKLNKLEFVKYLLEEVQIPLHQPHYHYSALHYSAFSRGFEVTSYLIKEHNFPLDILNDYNETPLQAYLQSCKESDIDPDEEFLKLLHHDNRSVTYNEQVISIPLIENQQVLEVEENMIEEVNIQISIEESLDSSDVNSKK